MSARAIFVDRDGTIIVDKDYLHKPTEVEFYPDALSALKRAQEAGFQIVMVTNQSGVGRCYFPMADVEKVHDYIAAEAAKLGGAFARIYVAPEAPDVPSRGRKPSPEFLFDARGELGINLAQSYMIGDKLIDLECGWNAGVRKSLLVRTGYGAEVERRDQHKLRDSVVLNSLPEAIDWILARS